MKALPPWLLVAVGFAVALWACKLIGDAVFVGGLFVVAGVMFLWAAAVAGGVNDGDKRVR